MHQKLVITRSSIYKFFIIICSVIMLGFFQLFPKEIIGGYTFRIIVAVIGLVLEISTISITKPTSTSCTTSGSTMVCGNITYKLHYDTATSTSLVAVNDVIAAKSGSTATKKTVVLTVEHTGTNPGTADYKQLSFAYDITFVQN